MDSGCFELCEVGLMPTIWFKSLHKLSVDGLYREVCSIIKKNCMGSKEYVSNTFEC